MNNYTLVVRGFEAHTILHTQEEIDALGAKWMNWFRLLKEQGSFVASTQLDYAGVAIHGQEKVVTNDPVRTDGRLIGGILTITAESITEAVSIAKGCPVLGYNGNVEVRPVK